MRKLLWHVLKHAVIAAVIAVVGLSVWYQGMRSPAPDPNVGKRAYLATNNQYLGVVVKEATDSEMGEVWIIESPSGYPTKYRKVRVVLR
jgi:hypothetical protein